MPHTVKIVTRRVIWSLFAVLGVAAIISVTAAALQIADVVSLRVTESASMAPKIAVGSLVIDRPEPTSALRAGEVVTLTNAQTGRPVTHRIVSINRFGDGAADLVLKGDDNKNPDLGVYRTTDHTWVEKAAIPGLGDVIPALRTAPVYGSVLGGTAALLALLILSYREPRGTSSTRNTVPEGDE